MRLDRPGTAAAMLALVLVFFAPAVFAQAPPLSVPHPELEEFKPEIREMLADARQRFERMSASAEGPELGVAYGRLGLHYFAHELQEAARACFENAATLDAQNIRWRYYLAVHLDETGDYANATRHYEDALAFKPDDTAIATRLALALLELDQTERAGGYLEGVLARDPKSAAAHAGLARVAEAGNNTDKAVQHYVKALELDPAANQLHYRLGQLYRRAGDMEKAQRHLEQRGIRIPSIDDPLLRFMQAHARPAADYVALGSLALARGEADRAFKLYDLAQAIDPNDPRSLVGKASIALAADDVERATAFAGQAQALAPADAAVEQLLGLLDEQAGNLDDAIAHYRAALADDADYHAARVLLANALMRAGRHAQAGSEYATLATRSQTHQGLKFQSGMAYIAGGECAGAEKNLLAAYQDNPNNPQVILALARVYATCPEATDAQRKTALAFAEAMYNSVPNMETSETYAMTLAANAQYDDAIDLQAQAIFEALKTDTMETNRHLGVNMARYREGKPALVAWPADHEVFSALPLVDLKALGNKHGE